ncbi:hypothetical protein PILCRDRAFT_463099 [Piloderma croceum F 1598]|uniref:Uncharacterized protein n=1 Tax=Piloderma croceum (strain F 1598) TaxID=765440 RepID=A0A0C3FU84_PILCF|nr:hypothetical protein PILCRDRAFT_463099 [Piloderma croceum F 1598]
MSLTEMMSSSSKSGPTCSSTILLAQRVERHNGGVYSFHSSGSLSLLLINTLLSQVRHFVPSKPIGGTSSVIICLIRSGTYYLRDFPVHPPQILVPNTPALRNYIRSHHRVVM